MKVVSAIATQHPAYAAGIRINPVGFSIYEGTQKKNPVTMSFIPHAYVERGTVYQILPWNRRAWHSHGPEDNTNIAIVWDGKGKAIAELLAYLREEYGIDDEPEKAETETAEPEEAEPASPAASEEAEA